MRFIGGGKMKLVNSKGKTILNFQAPLWRFLRKVGTAVLFLMTIAIWYFLGFMVSGI